MAEKRQNMAIRTRKPVKPRVRRKSSTGGARRPVARPGRVHHPRKRRKIGRKILIGLIFVGMIGYVSHCSDWWEKPSQWLKKAGEIKRLQREIALADAAKAEERTERSAIDMVAEAESDSSNERAGFFLAGELQKIFTVCEISLQGVHSIPEDTLLSLIGSIESLTVFDLNLSALAGRIESHPRIQRAMIRRRLPGTLVVEVRERREEALIVSGGELFGLDEERVVLPPPMPGWPLNVPVITGYRGDLVPGDTVDHPALLSALAWIREACRLPQVEEWICELHVAGHDLKWVVGTNGWRVRPGDHAVVSQAAALEALLKRDRKAPVKGSFIDLRFPGFLIVHDSGGSNDESRRYREEG